MRTARLDVLDKQAIFDFIGGLQALDVLFNCAGVVHNGSALQASDADLEFAFALNVRAQLWAIQAALPGMLARGGGSIINMASIASSLRGLASRCVYGTTKAAVIGLTKSVAADYVAQGHPLQRALPGHRRYALARRAHPRLRRSGSGAPGLRGPPADGPAGPGRRDRADGGLPGQRRIALRDRAGVLRRWRHDDLSMHYKTLPESDHALVLLRPIVEADLARWFAYLSTPQVHEHTSWNLASPADLAFYAWEAQPATASSVLRLAVALRSSDELVGTLGFHSVSPENRSLELAYDYAPQMWGQGLATHLANVAVAWAHGEGFIRVQATVLETNLRSARVLQRCGFQHEGSLRSYRMVRGTPGNFHMYSHIALVPPAAADEA